MFEAWTLKRKAIAQQEETLRDSIRLLSDCNRVEYYKFYKLECKDPDTYAVLNWLFLAGLHHFYLGKKVRGTLNLILLFVGVGSIASQPTVGLLLIISLLLAELPALFRSQIIVAHHNIGIGNSIKARLRQ